MALIVSCSPDYQHNNQLTILSKKQERYCLSISYSNLIHWCIYFAVRYCILADWHNDRDQFFAPSNEGWREDAEFQSDCLAFTLFHGQNRITCEEGINHWISFTEKEVDAPELFSSHWMTDYIAGRLRPTASDTTPDLFDADVVASPQVAEASCPLLFSAEARAVFDAGRTLWRYYMQQEGVKADASYYDIRAYFQGFTERGGKRKMNTKSDDAQYTELVGALRGAVVRLGEKLRPKVYAYGFLKA